MNTEESTADQGQQVPKLNTPEFSKGDIIDFVDWINNNWFIPTKADNFWELDTSHIEYSRTIPPKEVDLFDAGELLQMFLNGEGEN